MDTLKALLHYTAVNLHIFRSKNVAWVVLILLFLTPILAVILLASVSKQEAVLPNSTLFLFSGDTILFVTLTTLVISMLALGNDYELGTVHCFLVRGVERYQFILSKMFATIIVTLINGSAYVGAALLSISIAHISFSDIPLVEAAGGDMALRALGAIGVLGLVGFITAGVVMLALVVSRSAWVGMLAGLVYFFTDYIIGALASTDVFGIRNAYQFTFTYHSLGIFEELFASDPTISMPRSWAEQGFADPNRAIFFLVFYGLALTLIIIYIFRRQDLTIK